MMGKLRRIRQLLCQHRSGGFGFGRAFICADCGVLVRAGELDLASRVDWAAKRMDQIKSLGSRQISALDFHEILEV